MESFENQNYPNPETPPQPPVDSAAEQHNPQDAAGTPASASGKSSPYADSPFEVNPQRGTSEYTYQPQTKEAPQALGQTDSGLRFGGGTGGRRLPHYRLPHE